LQDLIPECVAVEIIDVFEVVKVYQEERMLAAVGEAVAVVNALSSSRRFGRPVNESCNASARSSRN
jgi:hypothetical protein